MNARTNLRVGNHPGGKWGTSYREILDTEVSANAFFVGLALDDYAALFAAAPALLAAVRRLLDPVPGETLDQVMTDLKMAAAKCEIGGTAL